MNVQKLWLAAALFLLIACERSTEDAQNHEVLQTISAADAEIISENFDTGDADIEDAASEAFGIFDAGASKTSPREYVDSLGAWVVDKSFEHSRMDTIRYRSGRTVYLDTKRQGEKRIVMRFSDEADKAIQYPKLAGDSLYRIEIDRDIEHSAEANREVYNGDELLLTEYQRVRDADRNHSLALQRTAVENVWDATISGEREIELRAERGDRVRELSRTYSISSENLKVTHIFNEIRRYGKILSGKIIRSLSFSDHTIRIETEFFEEGVNENIRYIRTFYRDGESEPIKMVTVYYRTQ